MKGKFLQLGVTVSEISWDVLTIELDGSELIKLCFDKLN